MTKQVTIKTCYILALLWIAAIIPTVYGMHISYNDLIKPFSTNDCVMSTVYDFMICPSTTDFDENGNPYWAKQSDGTTVVYENGKHIVDRAESSVALVLLSTAFAGLIFLAWVGLNSHYKWIQVNFKSCEKENISVDGHNLAD